MTAFMHERRSFEHEKEVRLLAVGPPEPETTVVPIAMALRRLINSVHIAPGSDDWFLKLVTRVIERYGYDFEVRQSDIDSMPWELA
ncbi:hypothetical protein ACIQC5_18835 [Paenarthrobacter sp. NPDC092416]|uniref:hypothetical protein n=1 Tax=Paenarthrobacter sp. NPDC092416 TaxID=3364386 RepID=UPI00383021D4